MKEFAHHTVTLTRGACGKGSRLFPALNKDCLNLRSRVKLTQKEGNP
jgi:hypothetical protein